MDIRSTMYFFLILIIIISTNLSDALIKFTLPKTDIVHPKSGLILHYRSEYRPANKIVTFTVTIPMYIDMCYLIPPLAMGKISQCLDKEATMRAIRAIRNDLQILKTNAPITSVPKTKKKSKLPSTTTKNPVVTRSKHTTFISSQTPTTPTTSTPLMNITTTPSQWNRVFVGDSDTIYAFPVGHPQYSAINNTRFKRFLPAIIAIGAGIASAAISAVNSVQLVNLKMEMRDVKESLRTLHLATVNQQTQLLHLSEGQLQVAQELAATQIALNKTMQLVNQHADILRLHAETLRQMISQTILLRDKLATATQAMESHFIHESMENILANKLNLHFIHHQDLPTVTNVILQALNLSAIELNTSLPTIEIISRLLVRQQIDFVPTFNQGNLSQRNLIGKLIITSYFAAPAPQQAPFSIYELFPIPFRMRNHRVMLANMPAYIGLEHTSQHFIRWSHQEASTCDFTVMPSCRESPIRRKEMEDDCVYQILADIPLNDCRTDLFPDKLFIHRIGSY